MSKYSVITINFNNRPGLEKTLASVRRQTCRDFEYIVIDGGSTDGSREMILENQDIISQWVSEPDRGIYNAMNKGVEKASGEYCLFLNSGDTFHDGDVMRKVCNLEAKADILFGRVVNIHPDGKKTTYVPAEDMSLLRIIETGIHHAGSFIHTSLMRKYPYDETLKICSDRKFFVQSLVLDNCSFSNLDFEVCDFELGGVSYTNTDLARKESLKILDELIPPRIVSDILKTNLRIEKTTGRLVKCRYKVIHTICKIDDIMIKGLNLLLGKKLYSNNR